MSAPMCDKEIPRSKKHLKNPCGTLSQDKLNNPSLREQHLTNFKHHPKELEPKMSDGPSTARSRRGRSGPKKDARRNPITDLAPQSAGYPRGKYFLTFILLIIAFFIYDVIMVSTQSIDMDAIRNDLQETVHDQKLPVQVVMDGLKHMQENEGDMQIMSFVGPSGVGKTFIANIIKRHFRLPIFEFRGALDADRLKPLLNQVKDSYSSHYNLIIFDDLTVADLDSFIVFVKELPRGFVGFVVCIFNIQETDENLDHVIDYSKADQIEEAFLGAHLRVKIAVLKEFSVKQASEWVALQLTNRGVVPELHPKIVQTVLSHHDVKYKGLKGLSSKINLEV